MNNQKNEVPSYNENKNRKRRRRRSGGIIIYTCILLVAFFAFFIVYYICKMNCLTGSWSRELDITSEVLSKASIWLSDIEGADIDVDMLKEPIGKLTIRLNLDMERSGLGSGTYNIRIDQDSYDLCKDKSYEMLSAYLEMIIAKRLKLVDYADNISAEDAHMIVEEVLGQEMNSYLKEKGVCVIPSLDDLIELYEDEGTYKNTLNSITWESSSASLDNTSETSEDASHEGSVTTEKFLTDSDSFVLPDSEVTYRKQVSHE